MRGLLVLALALALVQGYFVDSHVAKKYDESDFFSKWMISKTMVTSDQCQSIYQVRERGLSLFFLFLFFFLISLYVEAQEISALRV
jgi:hypothetical protein